MSHPNSKELMDPNTSLWAWLAHDLRFYREKHGLSLSQLGQIIKRTRGSVSACEHGRRRITDQEAKILDELWDAGGHFQRLLRFARLNHDPDWFRQHVEYEARATILKIFELSFIPGLLQTPEYARANLAAGGGRDVEDAVAARLSRQGILERPEPPLLWILLDEAVLERPVGGLEVMRQQLRRLLEAAEEPNMFIRVVPKACGAYPGQDGSFKIMRVDGNDVAYIEAPGGGRLALDSEEVIRFGIRYDRIGTKALPDGPSLSLIARAMESMR